MKKLGGFVNGQFEPDEYPTEDMLTVYNLVKKDGIDKMELFLNGFYVEKLEIYMVKTHLNLLHDPSRKGRPTDWVLVQTFMGAGFLVPIAGDIKLMPGMAFDFAYRDIDVDVDTGKVQGLF